MIIVGENNSKTKWDEFVLNNKGTSIYHQFGWKRVIQKTFGHQGIYLAAEENGRIQGILPIILMKSCLFGRFLVSLPFIDSGGLVADNNKIAASLCARAIEMARDNGVDFIEMRNLTEVNHDNFITNTHKVNFVVPLAENPEVIWKDTFHENVRNKVRKAIKHQLNVSSGNDLEYINDFYDVFSTNMRDLGTPVYPKQFFINIVEEFPDQVRIFLIKHNNKVIGGKLVLFFKDTLYFIYHSSIRDYAGLAPNNLLYWSAIEYGCKNHYKFCNMGRSTIESGPYKFKKQWGGEPRQLYWQYYLLKRQQLPELNPSNKKFSLAIKLWKCLPLGLSQIIGPLIAKHLP